MVTVHDVARAANVSIGTVSRVVNGHPSVRPGMREAVERAIKDLSYRPNAAARQLRATRTGTVGLILSDLTNPTFYPLIRALQVAAREQDTWLYMCESAGSSEAQAKHLERLQEHRVAGVILHPVADYEEQVEPLRRSGIPVVITGQRRASSSGPEIVIDEDESSRRLFELLISLGHRRIALLLQTFSAPHLPTSAQMSRSKAMKDAFSRAGLDAGDAHVLWARDASDAYERAASALSNLRPTAFVSGAHAYTPAVLTAIDKGGLSIPRDISVATFGDSPWVQVHKPALTAVRSDFETIGRVAADIIFAAGAGEETKAIIHQPTELVLRESCGLAPAASPPERR